MSLETALASLPPAKWVARQVVVFDWYDGPREGVAWMASPDCEFFFELLGEQATPDDLDDRFFRLSELPGGTVSAIGAALRGLGEPTQSVWVPQWRFEKETERAGVDEEIQRLLGRRRQTGIVVRTPDMIHFAGCRFTDPEGAPGRR